MDKEDFDLLFPDGITSGQITPYIHKGKWAVHQVLPTLLEQLPSVNVRIATFSISEDSLRPLFFMRENGKIANLRILLDNGVKRHALNMLLFASGFADMVHTASTHMKVLLIESDTFKAGIVGSANMNNNPRYEAGIAFTDEQLYKYYCSEFDRIFEQDSIPFYGID